ncbi:MAG: hypothetical protein E6J86_05685 [Deltaproteobacteria bacterium]|nr:MAG: hypothetical protein E6J86_05685 [Deltaproteobacteria bacterium]
MSDPYSRMARMKAAQQELPFRQWGGARKGAGRKRQSARPNVPHRPRQGFRKGALHVTLRMRREVWNLRTHRCFRALRWAFARGCERFGFRLVEFSVQGNHIHCIVEAPDAKTLSVLANWIIHAERNGEPAPSGVDPYCSAASHDCGPPLVAEARWWMLRVGVWRNQHAFAE